MEAAIFGLVGVALGSVLTLLREWWFQSTKTRKDAEYLSVLISCVLESFASRCANVVADDGLAEGQFDENGYNRPQVDEPTFNLDSLKVEWRALPAALMYKILDFPNQVEEVAHSITAAFEYASPPDFDEGFEERQFLYASLGLTASSLARELRKLAGLPLPERPHRRWDPFAYMTESKSKIESLRAERVRNYVPPNSIGELHKQPVGSKDA